MEVILKLQDFYKDIYICLSIHTTRSTSGVTLGINSSSSQVIELLLT